jgi:hypothetical protein
MQRGKVVGGNGGLYLTHQNNHPHTLLTNLNSYPPQNHQLRNQLLQLHHALNHL